MTALRWRYLRPLCCAGVLVLAALRGAPAAELDGITLPETSEIGGTVLRLNGVGLRTYSILRVRIYVAGLYLQQPTHDPEAILDSPGDKLLVFHFVHDVDAADARNAWREGFADNCVAPCHIEPADETRFLAAVPAFRVGDYSTLAFAHGRLTFAINGRPVGTIANPGFERAILLTLIGPKPPTEALKRGLLGQHG